MRNHSYPPSPEPILIIFRRVAPSIVGIARKKENSVARTLLSPRRTPPIIVAADLEVPGTIARHWKIPISTAVKIGSSDIVLYFSFLFFPDSSHISKIPYTTSITETVIGLNRCSSMTSSKSSPKTTAGSTATIIFIHMIIISFLFRGDSFGEKGHILCQ